MTFGQKLPMLRQRAGMSQDVLAERMGYLAKTKGYLLGWVLVVWGALDLLVLLLMGMGVLGMLTMW